MVTNILPEIQYEDTAPSVASVKVQPKQFVFIRCTYMDDIMTLSLIDLPTSVSIYTMLASENVLSRDWETPEEDEAWAHL